jgi:hypothetical protein
MYSNNLVHFILYSKHTKCRVNLDWRREGAKEGRSEGGKEQRREGGNDIQTVI